MAKVLTAMSGGVDSAVAAARLLDAGHDVGGAVMQLHGHSKQELADAKRSAEHLGIPFYVFSWQTEFYELVQKPFIEIYQQGGTPNPCVICNKTVKFGLFLDKAMELGYEKIATGHYAKIERDANGRFVVRMADDRAKDQTYMFWSLSQRQLSHVLLPMGNSTKEQTRAFAQQQSIPVAQKHDSQDICFIPDGDYLAFLLKMGVKLTEGHFIGEDGRDYGAHKGQEAYTIGQRRGLGVAYGERIYVTRKEGGTVYIGPKEALFSSRVRIGNVNYLPFDTLRAPMRCEAKLRYTPRTAPCTVYPTEYGAELLFDQPQRAVTKGQSAVLYDGDLLLGGGVIL